MDHDAYDIDAPLERLDADAVCAECGSVNPEGTLMCKQCGNNLRDQRARRVAAGHAVEEVPGEGRRGWLRGALTVLGILVVIWTALNAGRIEGWLVNAQDVTGAARFWEGPNASVYEELLREMESYPLSKAEMDAAQTAPAPGDTFAGRYALVRRGQSTFMNQSGIVGQAIVREEDNQIYFVAQFRDSEVEVRGTARFERSGVPVARETAGVKMGNGYVVASGIARKLEDGGFEIFGQSADEAAGQEVLAYRAR